MSHKADAPLLAREIAKACANFQIELLQQSTTGVGVVDSVRDSHGIQLGKAPLRINCHLQAQGIQASDQRPAYRYHRRFLQTLQSRGGPRRWLLKAPSHLFQLRTLFDVYPDALIIRTHRDPLETLPSAISLMGTLKWMRCREVDMSTAAALLPAGFAYVYEREIEWRESGVLPDDRFVDVLFQTHQAARFDGLFDRPVSP